MPRTTASRRSARAFLTQVAEELPNHLPPRWRDYSSERWGHYFKIWYGDNKKIHFEVQFVAGGRLEIAFHMEADADTNERVATMLERETASVGRVLGEEARLSSHGRGWRSLGERWAGGDLRAEEAATEAAARLAEYIATVAPVVFPKRRGR